MYELYFCSAGLQPCIYWNRSQGLSGAQTVDLSSCSHPPYHLSHHTLIQIGETLICVIRYDLGFDAYNCLQDVTWDVTVIHQYLLNTNSFYLFCRSSSKWFPPQHWKDYDSKFNISISIKNVVQEMFLFFFAEKKISCEKEDWNLSCRWMLSFLNPLRPHRHNVATFDQTKMFSFT